MMGAGSDRSLPGGKDVSMFDSWVRSVYRNLGLLFLLFFSVLGTSYAFLLAPFQVPDERRHWLAAHHHIAKLMTGSGTVCSTDVALDRHFQMGVKFHPKQKVPAGIFSRVEKLSPECEKNLLYRRGNLLSYPGVVLSRLFVPREPTSGSQSLFSFYLARLFHGLLIALLLFRLWWLARASTSPGSPGLLTLLLLSLSPLFVQQSFGVTNDVVSSGFALAVCTWVVFSDRLAWFDYAAFLTLGSITALTKPVLSVTLLPVIVFGLYLERFRRNPEIAASLSRSLTEEFASRRAFAVAVIAISVAGVVYATANLNVSTGRSARQFEFITAHPLDAFQIIATEVGRLFSHPSFFLDYLGYLDTRISAETLRDFAELGILVALIEMIAIWRSAAPLAHDRARRQEIRRALRPIAVLAAITLVTISLSILMIGFRAYLLDSAVGSDRVSSMQPRYLFPHLVVTIGLATAIARTLFALGEPTNGPSGHTGRVRRFADAAVLGLFALKLVSFVSHLSIDLLERYSR
jgi:hypothetical protein